MVNSRRKGSRGEREACAAWEKVFGVPLRRSQQYCGRTGDAPDIIGHDGIAFEVKRRNRLNIHEAINKLCAEANNGDVPVLLHRKDNEDWLVTVKLEFLPDLMRCL